MLYYGKRSTEGDPEKRIKQVSIRGKDSCTANSSCAPKHLERTLVDQRTTDGTRPTEAEVKGGRGKVLLCLHTIMLQPFLFQL